MQILVDTVSVQQLQLARCEDILTAFGSPAQQGGTVWAKVAAHTGWILHTWEWGGMLGDRGSGESHSADGEMSTVPIEACKLHLCVVANTASILH